MVSKNPQTFARQMSKKYPEVDIVVEQWNKTFGNIAVSLKDDPLTSITLRVVSDLPNGGKLLFYTYDGTEQVSFRKTVSKLIKPTSAKEKKLSAKAKIHQMLDNASALELSLVWIPKILENQVEEEIEYKATTKRNGTGLSKADAYPITRHHNSYTRYGRTLTEEEAADTRKRLKKYWKQFASKFQEE